MDERRFLLESPTFTTREFAFEVEVGVSSASRKLHQLASRGTITLVTRGIWAQPHHPRFTPYGLVPHILGKEAGYVSFLSALHRHGVISQIPQIIQVASTGHGRRLNTPVAGFEIFQLKPEMMMQGVEWFEGKPGYGLASAEKALLDCLYLSTRKGNRFNKFPEMDLGSIRSRVFKRMLRDQVSSQSIRNAVAQRFDDLGIIKK